MSVYNSNGTLVTVTSGANRPVAIGGVSNTTPIKITATAHGFNTGDTVRQRNATVAAANGLFQVAAIDANTYSLNGTTASGSGGAGGTAVDYELQPAYTIPANGQLADMNTLATVLEGLANPFPRLYEWCGGWRLDSIWRAQQTRGAGDSTIWSSNTLSTGGTYAALASASNVITAGGINPIDGINADAGDFLVIDWVFSAFLTSNANTAIGSFAIATTVNGGSPTVDQASGQLFGGSWPGAGPTYSLDYKPFHLRSVTGSTGGQMNVTLVGGVSGSTVNGASLLGPWAVQVLLYRKN